MAILYRDSKAVWRVKQNPNDFHDKGEAVPQAIRNLLKEVTHNQKQCEVRKQDGKIIAVIVNGETFSNVPIVGQSASGKSISEVKCFALSDTEGSRAAVSIDYRDKSERVAWQCAVKGVMSGKDYRNAAKSLPMMIRCNGLGATLAFIGIQKAGTRHYELLFEHLGGRLLAIEPSMAGGDLVDIFRSRLDSFTTRALTREAMVFLGWLSRYADGLTKEANQ